MKAAVYCRVSTEDQALHGYSLQAQRDECVKHLLKRGYDDYEVYIDDGYSAKNMNRPALSRMLEDVRAKRISYIVFWALDRLTRDTIDGLMLCRETFYKQGIPFASITEEIDMATADGEMMLTIRLSMARAERRRIGERTRIGYAKRAQQGRRNNPSRPYGYSIGADIELTVNDDEKEIVLMIFDWYIKGKGTTKIARELNIKGIPGPRGGSWNHVAINHILSNLTYLGYNHWKDSRWSEDERIVVKGSHEAIVPESTFNEAQEIKRRRSTKEISRSSYDFYYSSILKCALCGRAYHGKIWKKGNSKGKRYACSGKVRQGDCNGSEVSEKKVTSLLFEEMKKLEKELNFDDKKVIAPQQNDTGKRRKQIERDIKSTKSELEKLVTLYMSDKIDMDIYEKKRDECKTRIADLEKELAEIPDQSQPKSENKAEVLKFIKYINEYWDYIEEPDRKMIMQRLYKEIKIAKVNGEWRIEGIITAI